MLRTIDEDPRTYVMSSLNRLCSGRPSNTGNYITRSSFPPLSPTGNYFRHVWYILGLHLVILRTTLVVSICLPVTALLALLARRKQVRGESQELPPLGAHLAASRIPLLSLLHHLLPLSHDCHVRRRLLLLHQEEPAG